MAFFFLKFFFFFLEANARLDSTEWANGRCSAVPAGGFISSAAAIKLAAAGAELRCVCLFVLVLSSSLPTPARRCDAT
jgi:hypothetical protein